MKTKFGLRILLTSIALVTIAICTMVLSGLMDRPKINKGNNGISLEAPSFISSAEAAQTTKAFPADEAGIAAYVKVSTVDIEKIKSILKEVEEVGDNYIVGITPIPDFGGEIGVHLYADTDGWLVAYIKADQPAAMIMQWGTADVKKPVISVIQSTTLEDALRNAGDAISAIVPQKDIKYYDFEAPEANGMTLFIRTRTGKGSNIVQAELPATYTLYEASYYHYAYRQWHSGWGGYTGSSELKVDETTINKLESVSSAWGRAFGSYKGSVTTGTLHKIEISCDDNPSAGVATVLIYKAQ
ncbi:hypothetical protein FJZ31_32650 [Candidatus Poribacteria bacterium]|nr:hypothetical protein [Candidatus Poribacteria bacterium]